MRLPDLDPIERVMTIAGKGSRQFPVLLPDDETAKLVSAQRMVTIERRMGY